MTQREPRAYVGLTGESVREELASRIRQFFIHCFHQIELTRTGKATWKPGVWWDGGKTNGSTRGNIWASAAKKIIAHKLPLYEYVRFICQHYSSYGKTVRPSMLNSDRAIAEFKNSRSERLASAAREIDISFQLQQSTLRDAIATEYELASEGYGHVDMNPTDVRRGLLTDPRLNLTPLFRYCLAINEGYKDIGSEYRSEAMIQYLPEADIYDRVWAGWIPRDFSRDARLLLR